ncbi:MAG: cell division protein FtsA [bacterium]|nr:cell division protein FtsA [bacterium]
MARTVVAGIDIGTHQVKVVIAELFKGQDALPPHVIGTGTAESRGMRRGYIIAPDEDLGRSIRAAVNQAEKSAGVKIRRAFVAVGGVGLSSVTTTGSIAISRADSEITDLDVAKAIQAAEGELPSSYLQNRTILHTIPVLFKIDGKPVLGRPHGLKGMKLEVKTLFVTMLEHHLSGLMDAVDRAGIEIEEVVASPIAAALVTLSKAQKIAGCILANIGAETVSVVVYENNEPVSLEVFPMGSTDITNDIALGLKIPLEEAEQVKLGSIIGLSYPKKKLEEIIEARLSDILELIENHLKKIGRSGLLPAGIVLAGGGSAIASFTEFAKENLRLPARIATISYINPKNSIKDGTWAVAYGLCLLGGGSSSLGDAPLSIASVKKAKNTVVNWVKQFLP